MRELAPVLAYTLDRPEWDMQPVREWENAVAVTAATSYSRALARVGRPSGDADTHTAAGWLGKIPHREYFTHAPRRSRRVLVGRVGTPARGQRVPARPIRPARPAESCRQKLAREPC